MSRVRFRWADGRNGSWRGASRRFDQDASAGWLLRVAVSCPGITGPNVSGNVNVPRIRALRSAGEPVFHNRRLLLAVVLRPFQTRVVAVSWRNVAAVGNAGQSLMKRGIEHVPQGHAMLSLPDMG